VKGMGTENAVRMVIDAILLDILDSEVNETLKGLREVTVGISDYCFQRYRRLYARRQ
jgi:hypothetical protein